MLFIGAEPPAALHRALQAHGYRVHTAATFRAARSALCTGQWGLIVTEVETPDQDMLVWVLALKERPTQPEVPPSVRDVPIIVLPPQGYSHLYALGTDTLHEVPDHLLVDTAMWLLRGERLPEADEPVGQQP